MSYLHYRDFLIEVAKGNVPKHSLVHKFGRNDSVANGSFEALNLLSGAAVHPTSASTVRIKAGGNAADSSAGNGAREVTVVGVDSTLAEVSEAITTNGASASTATTASFWRVYRAYVSSAGTYGAANTGAITIEDSGGSSDLILIGTEEGQSQHAQFTVATGTTAYLMSVLITVDGLKPADFRLFQRGNFNDTSAPVNSKRLVYFWDGVGDVFQFIPRSPLVFPALTDLWFEAQGSGAQTEASVDFELLIVED